MTRHHLEKQRSLWINCVQMTKWCGIEMDLKNWSMLVWNLRCEFCYLFLLLIKEAPQAQAPVCFSCEMFQFEPHRWPQFKSIANIWFSCVTDWTCATKNGSYYLWKWLWVQLARCDCGLKVIQIMLLPHSRKTMFMSLKDINLKGQY